MNHLQDADNHIDNLQEDQYHIDPQELEQGQALEVEHQNQHSTTRGINMTKKLRMDSKKIIKQWEKQRKLKQEKIEVGDVVKGNLIFEPSRVIAVGPFYRLKRYDRSGAMQEAVDLEYLDENYPCVAVKLGFNQEAVYPKDEVWKVDTGGFTEITFS